MYPETRLHPTTDPRLFYIPSAVLDEVFSTFSGFSDNELLFIEGTHFLAQVQDPGHHLLTMQERPELGVAEKEYGPDSHSAWAAQAYRAAVCVGLALYRTNRDSLQGSLDASIGVPYLRVEPGRTYLGDGQKRIARATVAVEGLKYAQGMLVHGENPGGYRRFFEGGKDDSHVINLVLDWAQRHLAFLSYDGAQDEVRAYIGVGLTDTFELLERLYHEYCVQQSHRVQEIRHIKPRVGD